MNRNACHFHVPEYRKKYTGKVLFFVLFLCVMNMIWMPAHGNAAPEIPTPSWMVIAPVADKMIINGLPSRVHYFEAHRKLENLMEYYRQQWREGGSDKAGYREVDVAPWHVISKLDGRYLLTVQAREKDSFSIDGYLAVGDLKAFQGKKKKGVGVPKMKGSKVINDLTSYDPGKKGRTLMFVNPYSVASNTEFYRKYYLRRGWGQVMDQGSENAQVLVFSRFGKESHLVISNPGGSTRVVMNLVEGD